MEYIIKKIVIILLILLSNSKSYAFDDLTKTDIVLQTTYTLLHIIDWGTTLDIAKSKNKKIESNAIMSRHPSIATVNTYMASTLVMQTLVTYALPKDYRVYWQILGILLEGSCVYNNYNIGLRMNF